MRRASSRQAAFILKVLEEQNGKALKHQSFLTYHEPLARLHPQLLPWQHGRRQLFGATFSLPADKASTSKALTALRFRRIRLSISAKTNSPSCSDPMAACKLFIEGLLSRTAHKTCHTGNSEQLWPKLASKYSRFPNSTPNNSRCLLLSLTDVTTDSGEEVGLDTAVNRFWKAKAAASRESRSLSSLSNKSLLELLSIRLLCSLACLPMDLTSAIRSAQLCLKVAWEWASGSGTASSTFTFANLDFNSTTLSCRLRKALWARPSASSVFPLSWLPCFPKPVDDDDAFPLASRPLGPGCCDPGL